MKRLLLLALCATALLAPAAAEASTKSAASDKGRVTVDIKIKRFALVGKRMVARGVLTSKVEGAGDSKTARKRVTLGVAAQRGRCHVLTLTLDDLQLDLLGLRVDLSEVNLLIRAIPRGQNSGVLGKLFCTLARSSIRLRKGRSSAASAQKVVASLNSRMRKRPMRVLRASAQLSAEEARAAQTPSCRVLRLILGPLDLNLLGLVVNLYGPNSNAPVNLTITSFPGQGVLGDLFCNLSGGPR